METVIFAYVPVLHEGYRRLFEKNKQAGTLYLLGPELIDQYVPLKKDIRSLSPDLMKKAIGALDFFKKIEVVNQADIEKVSAQKIKIIMPDDEIMHDLHKKFFIKNDVQFDSIFLRWDKHKSTEGKPVEISQTVSTNDFDIEMMALLGEEAKKSSDFWRQIGAAIVKNGKIALITHNRHVPHEFMPYVNGDPRADFHKGINLELSTGIHAEASLVAEAAKKGISLEGASIYVNTFPCPPCAKQVAYAGIKKLYYSGWYGVLDAESILKSNGVEIIFVKTDK